MVEWFNHLHRHFLYLPDKEYPFPSPAIRPNQKKQKKKTQIPQTPLHNGSNPTNPRYPPQEWGEVPLGYLG